MRRTPLVLAVVLAFAGCGGGPPNKVVAACEKAVAAKLGGKTYELDAADMAAKIQRQGDISQLVSTVVFDKGMPDETRQTFECRVRVDPANPAADPMVTFLQFNW